MDQLGKLWKDLALAIDQGLTTGLSIRVLVAHIVTSTSALEAQMIALVVDPVVVETTISVTAFEVGQPVTREAGFSARELSPSLSLAKRSQGDSLSTLVEGGSSKRDRLSEGGEQKVLTHFFRLPVIISSRLSNTLEEFTPAVVAYEDLGFVWGLSATDRYSLFAPPISIVVVGQSDVLGSGEVSREQDEMRETCEVVERKNSDFEKELI